MPYDPRMPGPADSPLAAALERVGDRWSLLVIEALLPGPRRYGELQAQIAGIAPNILADRLRRLEAERVLRATPYSERPPRFTYSLTAEGLELAGAVRLLADWGGQGSPHAEPMRHAACGTPVEARLWCPTCARPVDAPEADELRFI
ncbi:MAG: winged helix-turn-helix transcriptional regulator [Candidatus Limnocylindria bacterium]